MIAHKYFKNTFKISLKSFLFIKMFVNKTVANASNIKSFQINIKLNQILCFDF